MWPAGSAYGPTGRARQRQVATRVLGALQLARQPGVGLVGRHGRSTATVPFGVWPGFSHRHSGGLAASTPPSWPSCWAGRSATHDSQESTTEAADSCRRAPARSPRPQALRSAGRQRVVGQATFPGQKGCLSSSAPSATQHLHVVGPTGAGKSALLARLIEHDLAAGRAVVVIEPKADLIQAVIDRCRCPAWTTSCCLDPTDGEHAVGLNVLAGADPELAADQLLHVIRELNRDSWGPRTSQLLHAGLLSLAASRRHLGGAAATAHQRGLPAGGASPNR